MAQAPMPMPAPSDVAAGAMGGDPMAGAASDADMDADDQVVVTICKNGDGSYTVYSGDEPEGGAGDADMSEDDADAIGSVGAASASASGGGSGGGGAGSAGMGGNGGSPGSIAGNGSPQGQQADSIGAALKVALDIMQADASSAGAPGDADSQFALGFSADKAPTPATGSPAQRY